MDIIAFADKYDLKKIKVKPKTILLEEGQQAQNIFFIEKGCLRTWVNNDGREITTQFFFENQKVASLESFLKREPSEYYIETIEESTLYTLNKEKFNQLFQEDEEFKDWVRNSFLERLYHYAKFFYSYIKTNPEERYKELLKKHPHIILRVPQHYIASYLGITKVSLSRIRNRIN